MPGSACSTHSAASGNLLFPLYNTGLLVQPFDSDTWVASKLADMLLQEESLGESDGQAYSSLDIRNPSDTLSAIAFNCQAQKQIIVQNPVRWIMQLKQAFAEFIGIAPKEPKS